MPWRALAIALLAATLFWGAPHAGQAAALEWGASTTDPGVSRLSLRLDSAPQAPLPDTSRWRRRWVRSYVASLWQVATQAGEDTRILQLGTVPALRFESGTGRGSAYLELGLGVHLLSDTHVGSKDLSTGFQFSEHLAGAIRFGPGGRNEFRYLLEHFSNGSIRQPNPGINFLMFSYRRRF